MRHGIKTKTFLPNRDNGGGRDSLQNFPVGESGFYQTCIALGLLPLPSLASFLLFHRCWFLINVSHPGFLLSICFWTSQRAPSASPGYATPTLSWQPPCPRFVPDLSTLILGLSYNPLKAGLLFSPLPHVTPFTFNSSSQGCGLPASPANNAAQQKRTLGQLDSLPTGLCPLTPTCTGASTYMG